MSLKVKHIMGINFKQFEILVKSYRFSKYERKLLNEPKWRHKKHYYTLNGAQDAIKELRKVADSLMLKDYPAMGDPEREKLYPNITPTITLTRFKIIKNPLF